jgi:hypothetical protein
VHSFKVWLWLQTTWGQLAVRDRPAHDRLTPLRTQARVTFPPFIVWGQPYPSEPGHAPRHRRMRKHVRTYETTGDYGLRSLLNQFAGRSDGHTLSTATPALLVEARGAPDQASIRRALVRWGSTPSNDLSHPKTLLRPPGAVPQPG